MALVGKPDPCEGIPTLTSVTATNEDLHNCFGSPKGWEVSGSTNIGTALPSEVEYYIERSLEATPSSFSYWGRSQGPTWTRYDVTIGADGGGASTTVYCTWKVWIVPAGKGTSEACSGPVTSNTASRTANACGA